MSEGDPFRPEGETFRPEGKQKSGMSTAAKVIIGIVVTGVVGFAICCGGTIWWFSDMMTQDPDEIREITTSIASIDIPAGWEPVVGMQMNVGMQMQMAAYAPDPNQQKRILMLMQMHMQGATEQDMEAQMEMQMRQQNIGEPITIDSSETRTFVIDGQEREFTFAVGTNASGDTMHQVSGVFAGRNGTAMLKFTEDDDHWDEAAIEKMIESISTQ